MPMITATLFQRTDCEYFKLYVGTDYESVALRLSEGHCFDVNPLVVLPCVSQDAPGRFHDFMSEHGELLAHGWFHEGHLSLERIVTALVTCCYSHNQKGTTQDARTSTTTSTPTAPHPAPDTESTPEAVPRCTDYPEHDDAPSVPEDVPQHESPGKVHGPTLWDLVETCETADASKVTVVRVHMEEAVGKERASELLACTKASSSRDRSSRKQRILTVDGKALRNKPK